MGGDGDGDGNEDCMVENIFSLQLNSKCSRRGTTIKLPYLGAFRQWQRL